MSDGLQAGAAGADAWLPAVHSMGFFWTEDGAGFGTHVHDGYDELCMVDADATSICHDGRWAEATSGTLYHFRAGERHGYLNAVGQRPLLWVLHYLRESALENACPELASTPEMRILRLDDERARSFRALFLRLMQENSGGKTGWQAASAAWLRLILVTVARWTSGTEAPPAAIGDDDPELLALWRTVCDLAASGVPAEALQDRVQNYDSLRHRFRRYFGRSPRQMLVDQRMEQAKTLLIETGLSIGAIAERLGYGRQHEFSRAFAKHVGCAPSAWRGLPGRHSPQEAPGGIQP